jgi:hypothetical protein
VETDAAQSTGGIEMVKRAKPENLYKSPPSPRDAIVNTLIRTANQIDEIYSITTLSNMSTPKWIEQSDKLERARDLLHEVIFAVNPSLANTED